MPNPSRIWLWGSRSARLIRIQEYRRFESCQPDSLPGWTTRHRSSRIKESGILRDENNLGTSPPNGF